MNKTRTKIALTATLLTSFAFALPVFADVNVTTNTATAITSSEATLNGTNGPSDASQESFWVSLAPIDTSTPSIPSGVYSTPVLPSVAANGTFSDPLSLVTTNGIPGNMPAITPSTQYYFVAWSNVGGTWYHGDVLNFTTLPAPLLGTLSAEDFGVVNYDTGLGILKGYTAGFGLTDATFASTTSVVVKLYAAGDVLLQTNTAILPKFNADITGTQFSSPFDVSGTFDYATDGYWTNVRETQFGQSVPAVKVVTTVTLASGKVVTAENTNLTGDPTTTYPPVIIVNVTTNPATLVASTSATVNGTNGPSNADDTSFWIGTTSAGPFASSTNPASELPSGWAGIDSLAQLANAPFSHAYTGLTPSTQYYFVAWSLVGGVWYPGAVLSFTTVAPTNPPPVVGPPTNKDQCKNDGWKTFNNPVFKNQGDCVSSVVSQGNNGSSNIGGHRHSVGEVLGASDSSIELLSPSELRNLQNRLVSLMSELVRVLGIVRDRN